MQTAASSASLYQLRSDSRVESTNYLPRPPCMGLSRDPLFIEALLQTTPSPVFCPLRYGNEVVARFTRITQHLGPFQLNNLYPLGGVAMSALTTRSCTSVTECSKVADALLRAESWHMARLCALDPREADLLAPVLSRHGFKVRRTTYPSFIIRGLKNYDDYLKQRSKSFRSSLKTSLRRATAQGFGFCEQVMLEEWKTLYRRRTAALVGFDYSTSEGFHAFLGRLIDAYRREERIIEIGLRRDNEMIGAGLGIINGDVLHFYQTAHDPAFQDLRPGAMVFSKMIELALNRGLDTIAFVSDAPYLRLYTSQAIRLCELEVFSARPLARALWIYRLTRNSHVSH